MAAAQFIGLPILCSLHDGTSVHGTVAGVNAVAGVISFETPRGLIDYGRSEIAGLEVLGIEPVGLETHCLEPRRTAAADQYPMSTHSSAISEGHFRNGYSTGSPYQKRRDKADAGPRQSSSSRSSPPRRSLATKASQGNYVGAVTSAQVDDDFDFGAGLRAFDKAAEFASIRSQDATDPALRLVSHNRLPASQIKMLPSESVLTVDELEQQQGALAASLALRDRIGPGAHV